MTLQISTIYRDTKTGDEKTVVEYPDGSGIVSYTHGGGDSAHVTVHDRTPNGVGDQEKDFQMKEYKDACIYLIYIDEFCKKFTKYNDELEENQPYKTPGQRLAESDSEG